jgi:hypothetical protein
MSREKRGLINQLASKLPEGMLVDAAWLYAFVALSIVCG